MFKVTVVLIVVAMLFGLATVASADRPHQPDECFPREAWTGPDHNRPCVKVLKVDEDGSFLAAVSDRDGDHVGTVIVVGNPRD